MTLLRGWTLFAVAIGFALPALAQVSPETPPDLEGIEIIDRSGEPVPGDVILRDEAGKTIALGELLGRGRPVLVQLVYYECPMLCTYVLNGYVKAAKSLNWVPGRDYEVVTVSFDPRDTPELATKKKAAYVETLGKPGSENGWHFLCGAEGEVRRLADALGFRYRWVEEQKQFAHAAGMFVLTPDGRVSRTLYGIEFPTKDLRLALVEAGEGKLGSPFDQLLLYCFKYDSQNHKYAMVAMNVMKLGGLITMVSFGTFLAVWWSRERQRASATGAAEVPEGLEPTK